MDDNTVMVVFIVVRFILTVICLGTSAYLFFTGKPGAGWFLFFALLFGWFTLKS